MKSTFFYLYFILASFSFSKEVYWHRVASAYQKPVDLVALPVEEGGEARFLVVEQAGKVFLTDFESGREAVLDWTQQVSSEKNEQGFFSLVLAPDFQESGKAYFNLTNKDGDTEIWRYFFTLSDLSRAQKPAEKLLEIKQHAWNHNGGWMGFGPDGMLYIATGDGGGAHDDQNQARNMRSLLGKLLRIDVSGDVGYRVPEDNPYVHDSAVKKEIFSFGLRNPWRCYWHGEVLFIADVGQGTWEEVNIVRREDLKGADFGWRLREGHVKTPSGKHGGSAPKGEITPALVYGRRAEEGSDLSGNSITGGVVYMGKVSALHGRYIFADYAQPKVWSIKVDEHLKVRDQASHAQEILPDEGNIQLISSFSLDQDGELYLMGLNGDIFKLMER